MKFLTVGAGSMGKRRIKHLKQLGYKDISVYDTNYPKDAAEDGVYFISQDWTPNQVFQNSKYDAVFICTPPTTKQKYIDLANHYCIPCFCEIDFKDYYGRYCPSNSMIFHPTVKKIKEILKNGVLGDIYTFTYHRGQHVDDWHPRDTDFWGKKKETSALKELLTFEMAWLQWVLGQWKEMVGARSKVLGYGMDDMYNLSVTFHSDKGACGANILIDIVSRPAIRELRIVGEKGMLTWDGGEYIRLSIPNAADVQIHADNDIEKAYFEETKACVESLKVNTPFFPYTQKQHQNTLEILRRIDGCVM